MRIYFLLCKMIYEEVHVDTFPVTRHFSRFYVKNGYKPRVSPDARDTASDQLMLVEGRAD